MPLSPPFRPSSSTPPTGPLPTLPFEIIRRIIFHRLAIPPSFPSQVEEDYNPTWDSWNGVKGRISAQKSLEERKDVTRSARGLMLVCKAWKPLVMKYLYSSPYLTTNLSSLASCILVGDSKWSDINLHEFSIPGRYITLLDLTTISKNVHPTEIRKSCLSIFPLLPNLLHLKLPYGELPFSLEEISWSPFIRRLKCLEGVQVDLDLRDDGKDGLIELLRKTSALEVLSVIGPGQDQPLDHEDLSGQGQSPLNLPNLHSLKLEDIKCGQLINTLIQSSLPTLSRLSITSHFGQPDDLTYKFQEVHGGKIKSLTYLQGKSTWPFGIDGTIIQTGLVPSKETLVLHSNLKHLSFLIPDYEQLDNLISALRESPHHPLNIMTIYKWQQPSTITTSTTSAPPAGGHHQGQNRGKDTNSFLSALASNPPKGLKRINVDGFKWVKIELGKIALDAGTSGQMRKLANILNHVGVELGDMDGNLAPSDHSVNNGSKSERVYGPIIGNGTRRRSSGGQSMIRMNIGMSGNGSGIERGSEEEDGG